MRISPLIAALIQWAFVITGIVLLAVGLNTLAALVFVSGLLATIVWVALRGSPPKGW